MTDKTSMSTPSPRRASFTSSEFVLSRRQWIVETPLPSSSVAVHNLSFSAPIAHDAWGRKAVKPQPVLVSVKIGLNNKGFGSAASSDTVDSSTVHYGILSKNLLAAIEHEWQGPRGDELTWLPMSRLLQVIYTTVGAIVPHPPTLQTVEITVSLPKASLLGSSCGAWHCTAALSKKFTLGLFVRDIKLPCLIGVNPNERLRKQSLLTTVEVEPVFDGEVLEKADALETVVVQTIEAAKPETLETLLGLIARNIFIRFIFPFSRGSRLRIAIAKPSAVPSADAPVVEVHHGTPEDDEFVKKCWSDYQF
ncbi:hypothetical protein L228DRAFT_95568 [Xylona heveae TC161]|uniref:Dihydroneopterin aldolase/epimerase domain-containing protein n=1 Tax=Xylona heveae (strain CBS 132557 / TC161) TaxID=1328760 RepID=A0A165I524_XYLHT|nr:hypothetical protein L228DRAFT_95568 [Xylona heveae TC161]KZF24394.1 hypothetical protein L228DRAFT_95568 [Xylona heveae TC161]